MVGQRKAKKNSSALGRALKNDRFGSRGTVSSDGRFVATHTTDMDDRVDRTKKMQSITQMTDFEEFYYNAAMAEKEFSAEKQNAVVLTSMSFQTNWDQPTQEQLIQERENWNNLTIPRRPAWNKEMTAEQLHQNESKAFLEWRRGLVKLEENKHLLLTPFERNIEVWKQLWRVCERCDVVIQIVDARNPLLFRCPDLEKYVKELNPLKQSVLLVNKADLLTEKQREAWAACFEKNGLNFIFFSANFEQMKLEESEAKKNEMKEKEFLSEFEELELHEQMIAEKFKREQEKKQLKEEKSESEEDEEEESEEESDEISQEEQTENSKENSEENSEKTAPEHPKSTKIYTREELLVYLQKNFQPLRKKEGKNLLQVGMVGYPNVGKSSTINVLVGTKKVAVGPTPGKTKHFQTIILEDFDICLCDCPGLVFPTFLSTKADMVCNGLLSVHQLQAHAQPVSLVTKRIPRNILESTYGIILQKPGEYEDPNRPPTAEELLQAYAFNRGWMTVHGLPNESVAARVVLKDYMMGRLCYVFAPPGIDAKEWDGVGVHVIKERNDTERVQVDESSKTAQDRDQRTKRNKKAHKKYDTPTLKPSTKVDPYENQSNVSVHIKGKFAGPNSTRPKYVHSAIPLKGLKQVKARNQVVE
eukprot:TRINITY_DN973_c0_g1_i2.p1 TRINITY_DN973_c0_g1~~TRINITY_DN973_c0_g1_i2.p1  ORF type:complete len:645 (-),score=180.66 TRINITY_DN973_c0_g1_i2:81-2015(-)